MKEKRSISFEINKTSRMIKHRCDKTMKIDMPTPVHGRILGFIYKHDGQDVFQRDIEKAFNIRRSTATNILQLMEKKGFITRENVSHDARLKKIVPTKKAYEINEAVMETFELLEEILKDGVSKEELDAFFRVLDKFNNNLKEADAND